MKNLFTLSLAALALSASPTLANPGDLNQTKPDAGFDDVSRSYPQLNQTFARDGVVLTHGHLALVQPGKSKAEIQAGIGKPLNDPSEPVWLYNVKLPVANGNFLVCQYKILFQANDTVSETLWRRPQCSAIAAGTAQ